MTVLLHATRPLALADPAPLAPILDCLAAVRRRHGEASVHGLAPDLLVHDQVGWLPGTRFTDGDALPELLGAAHRRWNASPHAAAALAWKSYTYWLALPAVLGYAYAGRVPVMSAENTLVRLHVSAPFLEIGLRRPLVAVRPGDPLAGRPGVRVVEDLPGFLRTTLLDQHLSPILDALRDRVRLSRRTLLGSLASAVGYALVRAQHALPAPVPETAHTLLTALGLDDLVDISTGPTQVPEAGRPASSSPTTSSPATSSPAASVQAASVRRRTCCLAFTLPEPKVCRGCCIDAPAPTAS